jgi:hypothetical protein
MPYIKKEDRKKFETALFYFNGIKINGPGDLNYIITSLCQKYLNSTEKKYTDYNAVIGALECAKIELYRRQIVAYEDQKIQENGDVYV